jgi:hypothetical protein
MTLPFRGPERGKITEATCKNGHFYFTINGEAGRLRRCLTRLNLHGLLKKNECSRVRARIPVLLLGKVI